MCLRNYPLRVDREPTDRSRLPLPRLPADYRRRVRNQSLDASSGVAKSFRLAGGSGKDHEVFFCESCGTYLWSRYQGAPGDALFVRAGTLDNPDAVTPDVHIFTRSKLPWLPLPDGVPAFSAFYRIDNVWSVESKERLRQGPLIS
jgi:hypothetical protein